MKPIAGNWRMASGPGLAHVTHREEADVGHALFVDWGYDERLRDLMGWAEGLERRHI